MGNNEIDRLINKIIEFRDSRNWDQHDTPENLVKSIVIEAAELLEEFQWSGDIENFQNVKDEIADIAILLLALVHDLDLDFNKIIDEKLKKIAIKYPIKK